MTQFKHGSVNDDLIKQELKDWLKKVQHKTFLSFF